MTVTAAARPRKTAADRTRITAPGKAVGLAAAHLRALGCCVERELPYDEGAFTVQAGPVRVRGELSWAGPVDLPLSGEADVQAACGVMHVHGRRYGRPTPLGVDYATCVAGALAATGALAVLAAGATGPAGPAGPAVPPEPSEQRGLVRVSTSVAQAALLCVGQYLAAATAATDADADADSGPELEPSGPGGPPFEAADGVRFELETLDPEAWRSFWAALGVDRVDAGRGWLPFQQRYATAVCPLPPALQAATTRRAFPELQLLAHESGVDLTPVADRPRPTADGDARHGYGDADATPWRLRPAGRGGGTPPAHGHGAGAPLEGVTVVEVCRRVQGPLAGHLLGLLGAHVVRVEPPGGDPMRGMPPMAGDCSARFTALNHGKDTVEADLATAAGRAAVAELAAGADVFLHSLAPGKDRRLGLDAATLTAARPRLVHAAASGWGDERGQVPPIGTDFPVQAWSGLAALVTPPGLPPTPSLLTLTDVLGGVLCAEGAVAGLFAARSSGRGQAVTSSLLSAARLLCRPRFRSPAAAPAVPVRTDLADLAADPRFAPALDHGPCTRARGPWEFHR